MKRALRTTVAALALLPSMAAAATDFELVNLRSDGTPGLYSDGSQQPAITPDGRYVVFVASAPDLVTPAANGFQVFLRDRVANTMELVSASTAGAVGNAASSVPSISADGCRVVFTSFSSNLVPGDANGLQDVFLRNRCVSPATTTLVSATPGGLAGDAASFDGRISG